MAGRGPVPTLIPVLGDAEARPGLRAAVFNPQGSVEERKEQGLQLRVPALKCTSKELSTYQALSNIGGMSK